MQNSSFINRSAILPDEFPGLDHSNGAKRESNFQLSERELKVLDIYHAFDLPPVPVRQSLMEAFFERCWTWMPVVDPESFMEPQSKPQSFLLLQTIFLAGSQMRRDASSYASSEEVFFRAKALLDTGYERDPLAVLASLCMIQWWNTAAPTDVSTNTSRFWVSKAVCLAQQAGLHRQRDPKAKDVALRRRIWWAIYVSCTLSKSISDFEVIVFSHPLLSVSRQFYRAGSRSPTGNQPSRLHDATPICR